MKIKNFFILLLACALLFAGCKVETDAPDSPASPAPSAAPTDFVLYRADSFRIGSQAYENGFAIQQVLHAIPKDDTSYADTLLDFFTTCVPYYIEKHRES